MAIEKNSTSRKKQKKSRNLETSSSRTRSGGRSTQKTKGDSFRLLGSTETIAHQKLGKEALSESEKFFRSLFDKTTIGMYRTTPEGRILLTNPAGIHLLGYDSFEEITQRNLEEDGFGPNHARSKFREIMDRDGFVVGLESAWKKKDGSIIFVRESATALKDNDGNTVYYDGTFEDITEQKQYEENLVYQAKLLENLTDAVTASDDHFILTSWNRAAELIYGWKAEEAIGKLGQSLFRTEFIGIDRTEVFRLVKETGQFHGEMIQYRKDGTTIYVEASTFAIKSESEKTTGYVTVSRDITERKRVENALRTAEADYRAIFERAPIGIFRSTLDGRFIKVNEAMSEMYGYASPEEMIATVRSIADELYSDPELRKELARLLSEDEEVHGFESRDRRKDGSLFWTSMTAQLVKNESGVPLYYEGFVVDITEQKYSLEALLVSEERLRLALQVTKDGLWEWNIQTGEEFFSPRWCEILGYSFDDPELQHTYTTWAERIHPEDYDRVMQVLNDHLEKGVDYNVEYRHRHRSGEYRWQASRGQAFFDQRGMPVKMIGSILDISERKQTEEEVRSLQKRFHALIEHGRDNISLLSVDGTLIWESPSVDNTLGYSRNEFVGRNIFDLMHPDDREWTRNLYSRVIEKPGSIQDGTFRLMHANGTWRWIECSAKNLLQEPSIGAIVINYRDVTERKRSELERQALLEIMQELVSTNDLQNFFQLVHRSIAKVIAAENFFIMLYNNETRLFEEIYSVDQYDPPMPPSKLEKSITSYVFRTGEPVLLGPQGLDELMESDEVELVGTKMTSWLGVPLKTPGGVIGVIAVQDYEKPERYSTRDIEFLAFISPQIALSIERILAQGELVTAKESLRLANLGLQQALAREQRISRTDILTDSNNRRYFFEIAAHEFAVARRYENPLSMIMFDIDHFKEFNDLYGHQAGDEVLKQIARIAKEQLREADIFARYGGEEFVVLLPSSRVEDAVIVAERIRKSIAEYQLDFEQSHLKITISLGVAECSSPDCTVDQLIHFADRAMYSAKQAGRNCVVAHSEKKL